jgi:dTDP-4-amino-4,6-dideoxygalactose transaminase
MTAVEILEYEFAQWLGVSGAVATGFGRGALWLALEAANTRGADVLVPFFICRQVTGAVVRAGAHPAFYHVKRDLTISPDDLTAAWTGNTRAAILPHYFGCPLPAIRELVNACRARGAAAIEDCALAMGAGLDGELCGRFGDFAVFSLTKSDWCFGGGLVTTDNAMHLPELRRLQSEKMKPAQGLCFFYGLLKWADHAANRPRWCRAATRFGRLLQALSLIREDNFYDAGRFDVAMPTWAAHRALRILHGLRATLAQRRRAYSRIREVAGPRAPRPLGNSDDPGATCAFMVFDAGPHAGDAIERANESNVTLRPGWLGSVQQGSPYLTGSGLLAGMLTLEITPELREDELLRIGVCLSKCLSPAGPE